MSDRTSRITCPSCGFAGPTICYGEPVGRPTIDRTCPECRAVLELPTQSSPDVTILHGPPDRDRPDPVPDD